MNGVFVDSSVVLDTITADPVWFDWSMEQIDRAAETGPLWINGIVFAEIGHGYLRIQELDSTVTRLGLAMLDIPKLAFLGAAQAFRAYRQRVGPRAAVLPDFIIGAHAELLGVSLLTRDVKRFRHAFPTLEIIAPD